MSRIMYWILVGSLCLNIILFAQLSHKNRIIDNLPGEISFRAVQENIVELENAIRYQRTEDNWSNTGDIIQKVDDVLEGIIITATVSAQSQGLSVEKEKLLWELYDYFKRYDSYSGFPNKVLNAEQIAEFKDLENKLQEVGWSSGYSSGWESLSDKATKLLLK